MVTAINILLFIALILNIALSIAFLNKVQLNYSDDACIEEKFNVKANKQAIKVSQLTSTTLILIAFILLQII